MAEDAAGSDPDAGGNRPEGDDGSSVEWGDTEPERRDGPRFSVDDLEGESSDGPERIPMTLGGRDGRSSAADDPEPEADEDAIGPEPGSAPIEREELHLENAVFVLLGAITMVLVLVRLVSLGFG